MAFDRKAYQKNYQKKYSQSEKGMAARKKYLQSKKYKEVQKKYEQSEKYKVVRKRYHKSQKYKAALKKYRQSKKFKETNDKYRKTENFKKSRIKTLNKYNKSEKNKIVQKRYDKTEKGELQNMWRTLRIRLKHWAGKEAARDRSQMELIVGCDKKTLRSYLETKFKPGMTWRNHGKWHIDHIIPLSQYDPTNFEDIKKANNYTNLQPLWAKDNLSKSNKVIPRNS